MQGSISQAQHHEEPWCDGGSCLVVNIDGEHVLARSSNFPGLVAFVPLRLWQELVTKVRVDLNEWFPEDQYPGFAGLFDENERRAFELYILAGKDTLVG